MASQQTQSPRRLTLAAATVLVLAGLAAYSDSFHGPLIYDDLASILDNPSIRHLWPLSGPLSPPRGQGWTVEGRPILNLSLALNYAAGGTGVFTYHAANLLIHLSAALALFGIVRRTVLSAIAPSPIRAAAIALVVALMWLLHPLQTEAVTYIVQRGESLMGLFFLLTLYGFIRWSAISERARPDRVLARTTTMPSALGERAPPTPAETKDFGMGRRSGSVYVGLSIAFCYLGMGTKEVMVMAPPLVLLYDRTFVAQSFSAAWRRRRAYYLGLASSWIVLGALVLAGGGNRSGSAGFGSGIGWGAYVLTQFEAMVRYLGLSVWPYPLAFDYGPLLRSPAAAAPYALVVLTLLGGTVWALAQPAAAPGKLGWRALGFAGAWIFLILAVTSLVPGGSEMIVERRMYLPLAALLAAGVLAVDRWFGFRGLIGCCLVAMVFGVLTWRRNLDYRSDWAIWSDSVAKYPHNSRAQYNLGVAYFNRGDSAAEIACYEEALRLDPRNAAALQSLGNARLRNGQWAEAIAAFTAALPLRAADPTLHYDLGTALLRAGDLARAEAEFEAALRLRPAYSQAHDNLGTVLARTGRMTAALEQYRIALALEPGSVGIAFNLANALSESGRFAEALPYYSQAAQGDPASAAIQRNFGMALVQAGRPAQAISHFEAALREHPEDDDTRRNLEIARAAAEH